VAAVLAVGLMVPMLRSAGWSLTVLPHVDSRSGLGVVARELDQGFHTVHPGAYDGQFYWGIAVDPLATGKTHDLLDKPSYRYGHPLYGWLGWLFSAGQASAVPAALAVVGLASMFAAAAAAAALGLARGRLGWEGLFVALSPGLVLAAANDLGEPLAAALMLGAFLALARGRVLPAWLCLALVPLAKEPLLIVSLAVVTWELLQRRPRRATLFATAALPALVWWTYARIQLGAWFATGDSALGLPFAGWAHTYTRHAPRLDPASRYAAATGLALLLILLAITAISALRIRSALDLSYLALTAVAVCLAANATNAITTALRNTSFLLALVPFVLIGDASDKSCIERRASCWRRVRSDTGLGRGTSRAASSGGRAGAH
jgi:hypothetical protein